MVSIKRWKKAQEKEIDGWIEEVTVEDEFLEIKNKYTALLKDFAEKSHYHWNWKVLDLGCGPTCISRLLPKAQKIGIDPLADRFGIEGKVIDGVRVRLARGEEIPFKDSEFNLVICRNVLDHVQSPLKVVKETHRVLKAKGYFILSCYTYNPFIKFVKSFSEMLPQIKNIAHPFTFTPSDLEKLASGRFIVERKTDVHIGYHPNDYGKINEKKSKWNFLQKLMIFINFKIFKEKWFVKEYCLVLKKK